MLRHIRPFSFLLLSQYIERERSVFWPVTDTTIALPGITSYLAERWAAASPSGYTPGATRPWSF
ncbi:MAG: hypothetical protein KMY53_04540 [Desulfarculus sp.]|nr:hypothetical protein [Pseudomonadota bacterium]MBV1714911.1 hypothetical protein [Desulfarculus sp.]MBU4575107.1 hypothetical protein [Pseudomonadota bacterium]MBU4599036.1 hypothetical protein [Pseudomonadota bacterium]MBV1737411.1 hypothetical protein [Desulfarculus sp.]